MKIKIIEPISIIVLLPLLSLAQYSNVSVCISQGGAYSTGTTYKSTSSIGQTLVKTSYGNSIVNYGGFLSTLTTSKLDTDGDGLVDENDSDNDNDGIADKDELSTSTFRQGVVTSPNKADTDNDGSNDGAELIAGTDPSQASSRFAISNSESTSDANIISVNTIAGRRYEIQYADNLTTGIIWKPFITNGIWIETNDAVYNFIDDFSENSSGLKPSDARFYRINVSKP